MECDFHILPYDLKVSTITMTCKMDTNFNFELIGKRMVLERKKIVCVKYGQLGLVRTLIELKKNKNKMKKKRNFRNQVSVIVELGRGKIVNFKLFKNGTIQTTGCKTIRDFAEAITILCIELKCCTFDVNESRTAIVKRYFVNKIENMHPRKVTDLKIRMINSNFDVGFLIDRVALYRHALQHNVRCTFDACLHAGVNVKFPYDKDTDVSIFIFETGSIIITGATILDHICKAYDFIVKYLYVNYHTILKGDIDVFLKIQEVQQLIANFV